MMMMTLRAAEGHEAQSRSVGKEGKGAINVDKKPRSKNRAERTRDYTAGTERQKGSLDLHAEQ